MAEKLDVVHHKLIVLVVILAVFITGIFFGVRINASTGGFNALMVINFALLFLSVTFLFLVFTQLVHLRDEVNAREVKKVTRKKKGQAALEFLSTYGWAILILLVMIGALSYFGVTNPKKYLPDKCLFQTGFGCEDYIAQNEADGTVTLRFSIRNGGGESVRFVEDNITSTTPGGSPVTCDLDGGSWSSGYYVLQADDQVGFICSTALPAAENPGVGGNVKFNIDFQYEYVQGAYTRRSSGEISTTVQ